MAGYYTILVLCLVCSKEGISAQNPIFVESPRNTVAFTGEKVQLNCSCNTTELFGDDSLIWNGYTTGTPDPIYMTESPIFEPDKYEIDDELDNGKYHLIIKNATLEDAGPYQCMLFDDRLSTASGLVILDSPPTCGLSGHPLSESSTITVIEGEPTELSCRVKYGGQWSPKMEWTPLDLDLYGRKPMDERKTRQTEDNIAEKILTIEPQIEDEGKDYTCHMCFKKPPVNPRYYKGINCADENMCDHTAPGPETRMQCSLNLTVHYGVRNITIDPEPLPNNTLIMKTGEEIECSAKGNPEPWIQWLEITDDGEELLANESSLVVRENMMGTMEAVCLAENIVNGTSYVDHKNVTIIVEMGEPDPGTTTIVSTTTPGCGSTFGREIYITLIQSMVFILLINVL